MLLAKKKKGTQIKGARAKAAEAMQGFRSPTMGWGRGPEVLRAPSHGRGGTSKAVSPLSLWVFHGAHKPVFCQGPRKSYAEVVLGGCSGVQGSS